MIDALESKYEELYITADRKYFQFQDSAVEQILATSFGDGTGVTLDQIRTISSFNYKFRENTSITTFDELAQFTNITEINEKNMFNSCTNLKSIDLSNITKISGQNGYQRWNFEYCTNLESVGDTSKCTTFGCLCFCMCTALKSINISNAQYIYTRAFYGCKNAKFVIGDNFFRNIQLIYSGAFDGCQYVDGIHILDMPNLIDIGLSPILENFRIRKVVNLGQIKQIGGRYSEKTIDRKSDLESIILPESLETIVISPVSNCPNVKYAKLLSHKMVNIDNVNGFGNEEATVCAFQANWKGGDYSSDYDGLTYPIYVWDDLVNEYKADKYWSRIAFRIRPMSDFETDFPNE